MATRIEGVDHPSFKTNNLDEIEQFYCGVLGLKIGFSFVNDEGKKYGFFLDAPDGTRLEFLYTPTLPLKSGRCDHVAFKVNDVNALHAELIKKGFSPGPMKRGRRDKVPQFFMDDPQENRLEFMQFDEQSIR